MNKLQKIINIKIDLYYIKRYLLEELRFQYLLYESKKQEKEDVKVLRLCLR